MKMKKTVPIVITIVLISVSLFSGCIGRTIDTFGWDHINLEGTAVRIWGQLALTESPDNWNEGFAWDEEPHDDWRDYEHFSWADNHAGLGFFSLNIQNLTRTTTYHYRAVGENLQTKNQFRFGVDTTFIPGGPRVISKNASDIELTQVTLKGELTHLGGAPSCEVSFLYGTDKDVLNIQTPQHTMTATGEFTATLTNLSTNTTYYFKAVAENDADSWTGLILNATPGRPVVVTRQTGETGNDHALLKGELWHTGGTAECTVWFIYGDVSPNQLDQSTVPQMMNGTGAFQAYIGNLSPSTKYWYRTVAFNGVAQGKGDIYEFTTSSLSQTGTSGDLGKPYQPNVGEKTLLSRLPARYAHLLEKYPMLLKLLQQSRFHTLLEKLT
jgi:hypothetical protein